MFETEAELRAYRLGQLRAMRYAAQRLEAYHKQAMERPLHSDHVAEKAAASGRARGIHDTIGQMFHIYGRYVKRIRADQDGGRITEPDPALDKMLAFDLHRGKDRLQSTGRYV